MNSPTDIKFKLPLSPMPMRKLKIEAEEGKGMTSPIYRGPGPIPFPLDDEDGQPEEKKEVPMFRLTCDSPGSTAEAVGVWLDDQQKHRFAVSEGGGGRETVQVGGDKADEALEGFVSTADSCQVLEVLVDTVD